MLRLFLVYYTDNQIISYYRNRNTVTWGTYSMKNNKGDGDINLHPLNGFKSNPDSPDIHCKDKNDI